MRIRSVLPLAAVLGLACAPGAFADDALLKAKGCFACHAVGKKVVGPDYVEVAKKYKGDKDAVAKLATSIQKGSTGKWGQIPMPPNKVSEEEATKLATWVLAH